MKKMLYTLAAASAACLLAPAANAAQSFVVTGPSGTFGNDSVRCGTTCSFTDTFNFAAPTGYNLVSIGIQTTATSDPLTNIDFTSVMLNGREFNIVSGTGISEFRNLLNQALNTVGNNTLVVSGTTGGEASYSGNLSFAAAVPEPATWGMMLVGFGLIAAAMRYRRRTSIVTFA